MRYTNRHFTYLLTYLHRLPNRVAFEFFSSLLLVYLSLSVVKVRGPGGLGPLLPFEPLAIV